MGAEIIVTVAGLSLIAGLAWFFFGSRKLSEATVRGNVQEVEVTVKGGYSPNLIRVREGVPLRSVFDRQESGECTSRVVFPDFKVNARLPAFKQTAVEFTPDRSGEFDFACGMNMVFGTLVVEHNGIGASGPDTATAQLSATEAKAAPVGTGTRTCRFKGHTAALRR